MDDKVDKDRQGARVKTGIQSYHHGSRCATAKEKASQEISLDQNSGILTPGRAIFT